MIKKSKKALSNYLIEDAIKEIQTLHSRNIKELNPLGHFTDHDTLYLYEPYRFVQLVEFCLKSERKREKLESMLLMAEGIAKMHDQGYVHGCLSARNVFLLSSN